jgi:uncharacterized protein (DUF433 family)
MPYDLAIGAVDESSRLMPYPNEFTDQGDYKSRYFCGYFNYEPPAFDPYFQKLGIVNWMLHRQSAFIQVTIGAANDSDPWAYSLPLRDAFDVAIKECPHISINPDVMAGAPCITGTRIPVYVVLEAIERHGTLKGAVTSYPQLNVEQVRDALTFAKIVVECPVE